MNTKEYMSEYKLAGTALLLRLTKPWHGSGRAISADSAFTSVTTAVACRKNGMHFTGLVKTATRMFPKLYLDEVEFKELGDDVTLTSSVEGHNIIAHACGESVLCPHILQFSLVSHPTSADEERCLMKMGRR